MNLEIKPLSSELLPDFLSFFDNIVFKENPDWSMCYCYSFHFTGTSQQWNKENNRSEVIRLIEDNKMKGYLAYSDNEPVGWCNANDRSNYQSLKKYYNHIEVTKEKVCSIVCFLIDNDQRRQGIAQQLLEQICRDYSSKEYDYLEAYPGKGELSCERHYKGPLKLYQKAGFKLTEEYADYFVVRKTINSNT